MKRLLLVAVAGLTTLALASTAGAEQVTGTGQSASYPQVHVNAKDNGSGPQGQAYFANPPAESPGQIGHSDVTCLNVVGNTARIGAIHRESGFAFFIQVIDSGSPGKNADQHRVRPATAGEVVGPDCNPGALPDFTPFEVVVQGNYTVKP
jgi:hypothetical protein